MLSLLTRLRVFMRELLLDYVRCYRWYIFPFLFWLTLKYIEAQENQISTALLVIGALLCALLLTRMIHRRKHYDEETKGR